MIQELFELQQKEVRESGVNDDLQKLVLGAIHETNAAFSVDLPVTVALAAKGNKEDAVRAYLMSLRMTSKILSEMANEFEIHWRNKGNASKGGN